MKILFALVLAGSPLFLSAQQLPEETIVDEWDESQLHHGENLARITHADKFTYVTHEDNQEEAAIRNMPVVSGDLLETRYQTYAEIEFIDGSLMQISDKAKVEFQAINEVYEQESLSVIKLHEGSVFLHVTDEWFGADARIFRVDTISGSAYIQAPGIYRVDLKSNRMMLKVYRGFAELSGEADSTPVHSGEFATIRNLYRPSEPRPFNSFHGDRFERWAYERRPYSDSVSAKYVDSRISSYSRDLDDQGDWRYEQELDTHVWVPYVSTSWRPYWNGYWSPLGSSLTWISYDPFGWVTHHYGRWGWSVGLGWYWIPGYYYSPGWVAWTTYNSYIGWCPLGYYNRPYYYRYSRPDVVIINNHHHRWNYVSSSKIVNRSRVYSNGYVATRGTRRITTRNVYVSRDDLKDHRRLSRVIRDPKLNRERAQASRATHRGTLAAGRNYDDTVTRVPIKSRNTGTRAVARHLPRVPNRSRVTDGSSILDRSKSQREPVYNSRTRPSQRESLGRTQEPTRRQERVLPAERDRSSTKSRETRNQVETPTRTQRSEPRRSSATPSPNRNSGTSTKPAPVERSRQPAARPSKPATTREPKSSKPAPRSSRGKDNARDKEPPGKNRVTTSSRAYPSARERNKNPRTSSSQQPRARSQTRTYRKPTTTRTAKPSRSYKPAPRRSSPPRSSYSKPRSSSSASRSTAKPSGRSSSSVRSRSSGSSSRPRATPSRGSSSKRSTPPSRSSSKSRRNN